MSEQVSFTYQDYPFTVTDRPNFLEADVFTPRGLLYAYVYQSKSGNRVLSDLLEECHAVIDEAIAWKENRFR